MGKRIEQLDPIIYSPAVSRFLTAYYRSIDHAAKIRVLRFLRYWLGEKRIIAPTRYGTLLAVDDADLIQRQILFAGVYEEEVSEIFKSHLQRDDVFYDIGANVGYYALLAAKLGVQTIIAVEPDPLNVEILRLNRRLNGLPNGQIAEFVCALAEEIGERRFYRAHVANTGMSGLSDRNTVASFPVMVRTLDWLVLTQKMPPPTVMKIDVEGFEESVLLGGTEVFKRSMPRLIIFEAPVGHSGKAESPAATILCNCGYRIQHIRRSINSIDEWENFVAVKETD